MIFSHMIICELPISKYYRTSLLAASFRPLPPSSDYPQVSCFCCTRELFHFHFGSLQVRRAEQLVGHVADLSH